LKNAVLTRLDQVLVNRGLLESRSKARDLILRGHVLVRGAVASKPSQMIADDAAVALADGLVVAVSRGADKLAAGLAAFGFDATGRTALDIGASTGGFTELLLARGATTVHAVDVGRGQLHARLRADPRVLNHEATDARTLTAALVPGSITAITADVSFISLTKALGPALTLAASGCWLVALIKPQFEAGPAGIGKGGIVRDAAIRCRVVTEIQTWLGAQLGWQVRGVVAAPITGGDGNQEFLIGAAKL
jgi:23S rRNA (cytidine1920-2'-O)/16S rRNA (cytidine1409-2'-O)-methyltransferase